MEQVIGKVLRIKKNNYAEVKLDRKSMCGESCAACGGLCGLHDSVICAKNTLKAKENDWVEVSVPTAKGIGAMCIAYGVPLLYMLVVAVLMAIFIPEKIGAIILICGVAFWFVLLHFLEKKGAFGKRFEAKITKITEDKNETV
ncbi:MAG: SoxR reducing system RseC family protein [Clostridia bacterium]|nr:SoxR reducing system RseC family protein [Clostridia bacterium]